jgi:hypothetical protein
MFGMSVQACGPLSQAEQDITNAINALTTQSANYADILVKLQNQLLQEAPQLVSQVGYIASGATGSIGTESRCDLTMVDALVQRLLQNIRIVNFHPDQKPLPPAPFPCQALPSSLRVSDINAGVPGSDVLDIDGFDFDPSWLDQRFPVGSVSVKVEAVARDGTISSTAVPNDRYVTVQDFNIYVNFNRTGGFPLTNASTKVDVYFNGDTNHPFSVLVTPGTVQPAPLTVSSMMAQFDTTNDNKNGDSILRVSIGEGLVTYRQAPGTSMEFPNWSTAIQPLAEVAQPLPVSSIQHATVLVCISPAWLDTWNFDLHISGTASDGRIFSVFIPGNHVTQDSTCTKGLALPETLPLTTPPPPPPPPDGGGGPPPRPQPCSAVVVQLLPEKPQCP